jgi:hypothetical protein
LDDAPNRSSTEEERALNTTSANMWYYQSFYKWSLYLPFKKGSHWFKNTRGWRK